MFKRGGSKDEWIVDDDYVLIRNSDGEYTLERGSILQWDKRDNDPDFKPSEHDPVNEQKASELLRMIPYNSRGVENRSLISDRTIIALKLLISRINKAEGYKRFEMTVNKHTVVFRQYGSKPPSTKSNVVVKPAEVINRIEACPICNKVRRDKHGNICDTLHDFQSELKEFGHPRWNHNAHWECFHNYAFKRIKS